jgi:NAD(P)-dependent dehydrogenase (short-subunit alcohol dehydrogenase family)
MPERRPVAVVTGVGPGTGAAMARRFANGGYAVAMLARNQERLSSSSKVEHAAGMRAMSRPGCARKHAGPRSRRAGLAEVVIHNAVGGLRELLESIPPC